MVVRLVGLTVFVGLVRPIMQVGHVGAVNTQGFVWKFFTRYIYIFIHSFIQLQGLVGACNTCVAYSAGGGL